MSVSDPKLVKLVKEVKLAERSFNNTLAKRKELDSNHPGNKGKTGTAWHRSPEV